MKKYKCLNLLFGLVFIISTILFTNISSTINFLPFWNNSYRNTMISTKAAPILIWNKDNNGTAVCTAIWNQYNIQICNDGAGGAIIVWVDERGSDRKIYAQKVNSSGDTEWIDNGTLICTATGEQRRPRICSDGVGGVIIVWEDQRGTDRDIYIQKVNSSGGLEWSDNGTAICTASNNQWDPQICSDGAGGAIVTWDDYRSDYETYAQKINSTGGIEWVNNGINICLASGSESNNRICSDGAGGAIIVWEDDRGSDLDIYVQKVNSSGEREWADNGVAICTEINDQWYFQICSDDSGGAIITWRDGRDGNDDIYAQKINSSGGIEWVANGTDICTEVNNQITPQICSDNNSGAIIVWQDERGSDWDIYAQKVNSSGGLEWVNNGTAICTVSDDQLEPQICSDGTGSAIITWSDDRKGFLETDIYVQKVNSSGDLEWLGSETIICTAIDNQDSPEICFDGLNGAIVSWRDSRSGTSDDIYAQRVILAKRPHSNHPGIINTTSIGSEVINWILYDDSGPGQYRVWANDTNDNYYISVNWTSWDNNTPLNIAINRTVPGVYNYTIEFNNTFSISGIPDTVIVTIIDNPPTSNNPAPIITSVTGLETINWTLYDDCGPGQYRVWVNDTNDNYYISVNWTSWDNNTPLNIAINRTVPGVYNYTIEFNNTFSISGIPDTVIVTIIDNPPTSNNPAPIITSVTGLETINWTLYDDCGPGQYRVWVNDTNDNYYILINWTSWNNNTPLNIAINRTALGVYNYTIEYNDIFDIFGIPDTVIVTITDNPPTSNNPIPITTSITGLETINWILYDDSGPGQYRVWVNDTNDQYYILINWTSWDNNTPLNIAINRTALGVYNYTIEYNDMFNIFGLSNTVIITIVDYQPTSNQPNDIITSLDGSETIGWILYDDWGLGFGLPQYRVWLNGVVWIDWTNWYNNTYINVPIYRSVTGIFNYTIEYNDSINQFCSDTVIVTITTTQPTPDEPSFPNLILTSGDGDILNLFLSLPGLGIIIGIISAFSIIATILIKNNRTIEKINKIIKELNQKFGNKSVSKTNFKENTKKEIL